MRVSLPFFKLLLRRAKVLEDDCYFYYIVVDYEITAHDYHFMRLIKILWENFLGIKS